MIWHCILMVYRYSMYVLGSAQRVTEAQHETNAGDSSVGRASDCRLVQTSDGLWFDSGSPDVVFSACLVCCLRVTQRWLKRLPRSDFSATSRRSHDRIPSLGSPFSPAGEKAGRARPQRPLPFAGGCGEKRAAHRQFSRVQSGKVCPVPGRYKLSKGMSKWEQARILGFETLVFKVCESKLWELTAWGPHGAPPPSRRGPHRPPRTCLRELWAWVRQRTTRALALHLSPRAYGIMNVYPTPNKCQGLLSCPVMICNVSRPCRLNEWCWVSEVDRDSGIWRTRILSTKTAVPVGFLSLLAPCSDSLPWSPPAVATSACLRKQMIKQKSTCRFSARAWHDPWDGDSSAPRPGRRRRRRRRPRTARAGA